MPRIPLVFPKRGLSDATAPSEQPTLTTRVMRNARVRDPITGRFVGAQRAGLSRTHTTPIVASQKVQALAEVTYDAAQVTYTSLGFAPEVAASSSTASKADCDAIVTDRLGDVYYIDGGRAIVKQNPDLREVWRIALPIAESAHKCRALFVDDNLLVYAAVSSGGRQKSARMWCYAQKENDKTELVWQIEPGRFVEQISVSDGALVTSQNDSDRWKSYVAIYTGQSISDPTLAKQWEVPYPINGHTASPIDGSVITAHEPNTLRGLSPQSPGTTASVVDWTPNDLLDASLRIRSWLKSDDIDGDGSNNSAYTDGEVIGTWYDSSPNNINLYDGVGASVTGPTLRKVRVSGRDVLTFSGAQSLQSEEDTTDDSNASSLNKSLLPQTSGAQYVVFLVVQCDASSTQRNLVYTQPNGPLASINVNRYPDATLSDDAPAELSISVGLNGAPAHGREGQSLPGSFSHDGYAIIACVENHGVTDVSGDVTPSSLWVNGTLCDKWTSSSISGRSRTRIACDVDVDVSAGSIYEVVRFSGTIMEILVLQGYESSGSTPASPPTRQRLIEMPRSNMTLGWQENENTEFDRIVGYLAGRWGLSHKLPCGRENRLVGSSAAPGTAPADGSMVTISSGAVFTPSAGLAWTNGTLRLSSASALFASYTWASGDIFIFTAGAVTVAQAVVAAKVSSFALTMASDINGAGGDIAGTTITGYIVRAGATIFTYTFKTTIGTAAGDVLRGADGHSSFVNLERAINGSGQAGVNYGRDTVANSLVVCRGVLWEIGATASGAALVIQSRNADTDVTFNCAVIGTTNSSWSYAAGRTADAGVTLGGHYPHPFYLESSNYTRGTPPPHNDTTPFSITGANWDDSDKQLIKTGAFADYEFEEGDSVYISSGTSVVPDTYSVRERRDDDAIVLGRSITTGGVDVSDASIAATVQSGVGDALLSPWGIVVKWDNNSGKPRWIATSNWDGRGDGIGGLGYGVICNSLGHVYCTGPAQASDTYPTVSADPVTTRKLIDLGGSFLISNGTTDTTSWDDQLVGQRYRWPRMAVDQYDNVFVPLDIDPDSGGAALIAYRPKGANSSADNASPITQVDNGSGSEFIGVLGRAVAVDPNYIDFPNTFTTTDRIAEHVYLGTKRKPSTDNAIYKMRLVSSSASTGSHRVESRIAIVNGTAYDVTTPTAPVSVSGSFGLDASARFIDWATVYSEMIFTDGRQYRIWQPRTGTWGAFRSRSSGQIPLRARFVQTYAGRLFLARFADNPHSWACSAIDNIYDWNVEPAIATVDAAVSGPSSPIGKFPYLINGLAPIDDDNMIVGCAGALMLMRGDPAAGGRIDQVISPTGMAFGRAWCIGPDGTLWFIGDEGGLWSYTPGGEPRRMSHERIERRLGSIDLELYRPELWWNERDDALHITLIPYGTPSASTIHFVWERTPDAFSEDTFATADMQPACVLITDGDGPDDRRPLLGGHDGRIYVWDRAAVSDAGERIDSDVVLSTFNGGESMSEMAFSNLDIQLASQQSGCTVEVYGQTEPDELGEAWEMFNVEPGRNDVFPVRVSGSYVALRLRGRMSPVSRWSFVQASIHGMPLGMKRVR